MNDKTAQAIKVKLLAGKRYSFCSCGLSKNLPYCDNAHRPYNEKEGTNYKSLKIFPDEDTEVRVFSATWKR
jgi:CDGSH-type Zn-finger protein